MCQLNLYNAYKSSTESFNMLIPTYVPKWATRRQML